MENYLKPTPSETQCQNPHLGLTVGIAYAVISREQLEEALRELAKSILIQHLRRTCKSVLTPATQVARTPLNAGIAEHNQHPIDWLVALAQTPNFTLGATDCQ